MKESIAMWLRGTADSYQYGEMTLPELYTALQEFIDQREARANLPEHRHSGMNSPPEQWEPAPEPR